MKHVSDSGNQHNNGPYQAKIFDNPSAPCLALCAKNQVKLCPQSAPYGGSKTLSSLFFFFPSDLLSLRSSRSEYTASTINYLLAFSILQPKQILLLILFLSHPAVTLCSWQEIKMKLLLCLIKYITVFGIKFNIITTQKFSVNFKTTNTQVKNTQWYTYTITH